MENAQVGKEGMAIGMEMLGSLGPTLYHWIDDGKYP